MEGKYYIYRHIRLDKNEPFYIGMGTKGKWSTYENEYVRAFSTNRGAFWKRIVSKAGYEVEILIESDNYEFILEKEMEFIKLYGRRDIKEGTLANLTDGGRGSKRYKHTEEVMLKMCGENNKFFNRPACENPASEPAINTLILEIYDSAKEASKVTGYSAHDMRRFMRGERKNPTYFVYLKNYIGEIHYPEKRVQINRKLKDTVTGEIFENAHKASEALGLNTPHLRDMLNPNSRSKNKTNLIYLE